MLSPIKPSELHDWLYGHSTLYKICLFLQKKNSHQTREAKFSNLTYTVMSIGPLYGFKFEYNPMARNSTEKNREGIFHFHSPDEIDTNQYPVTRCGGGHTEK